jgi:hypothetical protein
VVGRLAAIRTGESWGDGRMLVEVRAIRAAAQDGSLMVNIVGGAVEPI